jgi:trk system potassium uptake protein TrkH
MLRSKYQTLTDSFSENVFKARTQSNPIMLVVLCYLLLIAIGTALLSLPQSTTRPIDFIEAFFTAMSAVCVTGLSVVDIASTFTHTGLWILVTLMQLGGLGIMTASTTIILLAGMHPGFSHQSVFLSEFTQEGNIDAGRILKAVIPFTFVLELIGGIVYFTQFESMETYDRVFCSLFQAVSSFCGVGFTLFPNSLESYQYNPVMNITTCILVLAGGFGFLAIAELRYIFDFTHKEIRRVSLHTRIATYGTLIVIVASIIVFSFTEWDNLFSGHTFGENAQSVLFMAFTSRTAGLNSVNIPDLTQASLFFFIIIMFIGANPGSCGGGIKITTAAVIGLLGINRLLGREKTQVLGRTIPNNTIDKAIRIVIVAMVVIATATLILLCTEIPPGTHYTDNGPFLKILFEVVSAYATCGLSMGLTSELSLVGKYVICVVMFIGRMGPLFLISAVAAKLQDTAWFAEEDIMVG